MRAPVPFLLLLLAAIPASAGGGVVRNKDYNFELRTPEDSIDWDIVPVTEKEKKQGFVAHLNTTYADSDPPAAADVYVIVRKLSPANARLGVEFIAKKWREALEGFLENARDRKEGMGKLGGVDCYEVDVTGENKTSGGRNRFQYAVAMNGEFLYFLTIYRTYDAVKDEDLDAELKQIRDSFRFQEIRKVKAHRKAGKADEAPPPTPQGGAEVKEDEIPAERVARRELEDKFWRFRAVKPQGLILVPVAKFSESEKTNGVVLKMERRKGQTYCLIRVYAKSTVSGQQVYAIPRLAKRYIQIFEKTYKKNMRLKPEINKRWKLWPLTKKSLALKLTGRRSVPEVTRWHLADCTNGRQYQVQIYVTGGTGERVWKNQIDDFLTHFEPFK